MDKLKTYSAAGSLNSPQIEEFSLNAELDKSVSYGTLRPQDLFPAFLDVIKGTEESKHFEQMYPDDAKQDPEHPWYESKECQKLLDELMDKLDELAPEGYRFGSTDDWSDFGFWKDE